VQQESGDFWWLGSREGLTSLWVGFGHTEDLPQFDEPAEILPSIRTYDLRSPDPLCAVDALDSLRDERHAINVFRTLCVFDESGQPVAAGPLYLDIDAEARSDGSCDLEDAATAARHLLRVLSETGLIDGRDFRILFSGHKGFNVEVRPESLGLLSRPDSWLNWREQLEQLRDRARLVGRVIHSDPRAISNGGTIIDSFLRIGRYSGLRRPWLRMENSINSWVSSSDVRIRRMKFRLSEDDLRSMSIDALISESERRAVEYG